MSLQPSGTLRIGTSDIEYRLIGPQPDDAPTIVMLHEGLGSSDAWGDFPNKLQAATGAGVFLYSRAGYGASSPVALPRSLDFMEREALDVLPQLLQAIGFRRGLLLGHSDGASIATTYAGGIQDHRVRGVIAMAPHFMTEDLTLESIRKTKQDFESGELRSKLARWHKDVDHTFNGWVDVWLNPEFRSWNISEYLAYVRVPMAIIQGADDQYGTTRQIEIAEEECYCPVEVTVLPNVRHSPHRDAPEATVQTVAEFANRLLKSHGEGTLHKVA